MSTALRRRRRDIGAMAALPAEGSAAVHYNYNSTNSNTGAFKMEEDGVDWRSVLEFDVEAAQQLELVEARQSEQLQRQMVALSRNFLEMSLSVESDYAVQVRVPPRGCPQQLASERTHARACVVSSCVGME